MGIRAASRVMARLVGIVDAVAVLRPVHDAHIMVSHSTRVLAVFIVARAAAVLHRCSYRAVIGLWFCWCGLHWARFLRGGDSEEWTSAVMEEECGAAGCLTACVGLAAPRRKIVLASRDILAPTRFPVDAA